jgi:hypothetical protein
MKVLRWGLLSAGLVLAAGCGGNRPPLAAVSGRVTVDGQPYPNAYVNFQPVGASGKPEPGRGSMGITDEHGRFTLVYDGGPEGAVVGRHVVRITTVQEADDPARFEKYKDTGTPDGEPIPGAKGLRTEIIPKDWNADSTREFTVPSEGTDQANFDIVTGRKKGR